MGLKAHVSFSLPDISDGGPKIVAHFSSLGYILVEQQEDKWVFHRGRKLASLFRFDIRAYATILTVCARPGRQSDVWISCDWDVWTFMAVTTGADISTLEAEGRQLESSLRNL